MLMFLGLSLSRARTQNKTLFEVHRVPGNFPIDPSAGWIMDAVGPLRVRKIFHNGARKSTGPSSERRPNMPEPRIGSLMSFAVIHGSARLDKAWQQGNGRRTTEVPIADIL
jgi:hypothetical protein